MSIHLRIASLEERRPSFQSKSRSLIRSSDPPNSPSARKTICEAVETDGRPCNVALPSEGQDWCNRHAQDLKDLNMAWEKIQKEAERMDVRDAKSAKLKIDKLHLAINLRRRLRERFHTRGVDTVDFMRWFAKIEQDTSALADSILSRSHPQPDFVNFGDTPRTYPKADLPTYLQTRPTGYLEQRRFGAFPAHMTDDLLQGSCTKPLTGLNLNNHRSSPISPESGTLRPEAEYYEKIMILQSPLSPRIPISALQTMPDNGSIIVLKHFSNDLCSEVLRRLYSIVPDLDDSNPGPECPRDLGTDIVRAWFRIMILNDSEAEALEHASRSRNIDDFLRGRQASQLEMYCDYFENAWRPHAVQYLRVAICAQTLAGGDIKTVRLLGGIIPSTTEGLRMRKPSWDILNRWFPTLLTPWTVASICSNFEDYTTICKMLMIGLYKEHWYDPSSILNECTTGVYLGFVPTSKGDYTASHGVKQEDDHVVHRQTRNYLCGQMAMGDPLTRDFLDELRKRTERLYLVVYEGTNADATVHPTEPDLFISRHRFARTRDELSGTEWTTSMTLEDVKNQLRLRKHSMYDPIVVDSWQFIVIDREVGQPFELMHIVQDTLLMLVGDPSPRQIAKRVVREIIPPSIQDIFMEQMTIESSADLRYSPPLEIQYEGNRYRCHDPDRSIITTQEDNMLAEGYSRNDRRFIRRVVEDMERCGIISLVTEYEEPHATPIIVQGADGAMDLYFPYEHREETSEGSQIAALPFPPTNSLLEFAHDFKQSNPTGIMAKGSIQTHYCAWPMPAMRSLGSRGTNFATPEGHIYHWNAMPFDRPWSAHAWQYYIEHHINAKYPFVKFHLTSFVICAADTADAHRKMDMLLAETEDRGWRISVPREGDWTAEPENLQLDRLFKGVRPM